MIRDKDYYRILNVDRTATAKEIQQAFHSLAKQYHPDINHSDSWAEERFKEINAAYEVLGDVGKRAAYDQRLGATTWYQSQPTDAQTSPFRGYQEQSPAPPADFDRWSSTVGDRRQRFSPVLKFAGGLTIIILVLALAALLLLEETVQLFLKFIVSPTGWPLLTIIGFLAIMAFISLLMAFGDD